jgi:hypothetical protein
MDFAARKLRALDGVAGRQPALAGFGEECRTREACPQEFELVDELTERGSRCASSAMFRRQRLVRSEARLTSSRPEMTAVLLWIAPVEPRSASVFVAAFASVETFGRRRWWIGCDPG